MLRLDHNHNQAPWRSVCDLLWRYCIVRRQDRLNIVVWVISQSVERKKKERESLKCRCRCSREGTERGRHDGYDGCTRPYHVAAKGERLVTWFVRRLAFGVVPLLVGSRRGLPFCYSPGM
eukprot:scaffold2519_cov168-Amphora_coffeaeformis.AAC.33